MPVTNAYTMYAVNIQTAAAVDLFLDGIQSWTLGLGIEEMLNTSDGDANPTFVAVSGQNPTMEFSTIKLTNALTTIGVNGLKIDSDVDDDGLEAWFRQVDEGGTRKIGSNHTKMTINEGIITPTNLTADNDTPATLNYLVSITYDGTNDPIVFAGSEALEGVATADVYHTLGPININGTTVTGIQSMSVDFGNAVRTLRGDGQEWPTFVYSQAIAPTIRFRTLDVDLLRSLITIDGVPQSTTDSVVFLRKLAEGGTRVPDGTAEHISFTIDEGMISAEAVNGDPELGLDVMIRPTFDGTNAILVVSTATAIT